MDLQILLPTGSVLFKLSAVMLVSDSVQVDLRRQKCRIFTAVGRTYVVMRFWSMPGAMTGRSPDLR